MMGASNPHPHGQIWATARPAQRDRQGTGRADATIWREHGSCLLCDYLKLEQEAGERIVFANEHFTVLVPFWAIWPFETMVLPHRHIGGDRRTDGRRVARRSRRC